MARLGLWDELRSTRTPEAEETIRTRLPGILTTMNIHWTVYGYGETDTRYSLDVIEERTEGLALAIPFFRLDPSSMLAKLSSDTLAQEDYGTMKTIYVAKLSAGEVMDVNGWTWTNRTDEHEIMLDPEVALRTPPTMTPQEALLGFELSLEDAHF